MSIENENGDSSSKNSNDDSTDSSMLSSSNQKHYSQCIVMENISCFVQNEIRSKMDQNPQLTYLHFLKYDFWLLFTISHGFSCSL